MSAGDAAPAPRRSGPRWLLFGSLALNQFFVGVAVAMALRGPPPHHWDRNVFVRVGWLADALPPADGKILRGAMQANHAVIAKAQDEFHAARRDIRDTLRHDPFDPAEMRAAMAKSRAARQSFDQTVEDVFVDAASKMSPAGRHALADWRRPKHSKRNRH
ncbi:MAG: periplasmic heavy metal sensor [Pseudolabrys sp.]